MERPQPTPPPPGGDASGETRGEPRVIKRYANRKLYDTRDSRYVTLAEIAVYIREGQDVRIVDNNTKENLTGVTLAQIIYEEEKKQRHARPLGALREMVHAGGEKLLRELRDGPVGKLIRRGEEKREEAREALQGLVSSSRETLEEWQRRVDESVRSALGVFAPFVQMQNEVERLRERVAELETKLLGGKPRGGAAGAGKPPAGGKSE